jgi:hypothetical protein
MRRDVVDEIVSGLRIGVQDLPQGFYDSFEFTTTGRNWTHPWTLGLLAKILWGLKGVSRVAIDVRFNSGDGTKFQPDLVAYRGDAAWLFVDYESPNSCDCRIPEKDVHSFIRFLGSVERKHPVTPMYVIITSLPDRAVESWQLRYCSQSSENRRVRHRLREIRRNPCKFWYAYYREKLKGMEHDALQHVHFLNLDGSKVVRMGRIAGA